MTNPTEDLVPGAARAATGHGLRMVTVAPATSPGSQNLRAADGDFAVGAYLGCTIDDRYKVEALLGEGGMGVVYLCRHTVIGKKVAMKILRADLARNSEVTERFLNEAKAASAIGNLHIIDIVDFGRLPDGSTYFVMEHLDGVPLTALIEGGSIGLARLIRIARQLAEGLAAAHAAGIVHRDLKPDNIFLVQHGTDPDFVKILDFGIAKVTTSSEGRLTQAGAVFGTPHYMSPEQAAGAPVDERGDIYSLGIILYELLCGRVPFDADNFMGILTQHMYKDPAPMRQTQPTLEISPGLEAIVMKCLTKSADGRYQSMADLEADLVRVERGEIPIAVAEMMERSGGFAVPPDYFANDRARTTLRPSRTRGLFVLVGAAVALAIAFVVVMRLKSTPDVAVPSATVAVNAPPAARAVPEAQPQPKLNPESEPELKVLQQVVLAIEPIDAHVYQGDKDLGTSPVVLTLEGNRTLDLEIKRPGFLTTKLSVDGSQERRSVRLKRAGSGRVAGNAAAKDTAAKSSPGGEIVNPWK